MSGTLRACHKSQEDEDGRIGQTIDCYRLVRRIASGGMGTVYEAVHVHLGRRYAMKVLNPQLQGNAQATARFIAEGQAANQPAGQGVVAVHNVGRAENGSIYILMEYLEGETLSARIATAFGGRGQGQGQGQEDAADTQPRRPRSPSREYLLSTLRLSRQLAATLESIHRSGVIHRDLKPENVFVIKDVDAIGGERVKILDFGIAKVVGRSGQHINSPVTWAPTLQRTVVGTVLGTPAYMAPEQWRGDGQADARTDVYGLGAIFYEMFAGRPPFSAKLIGDLMALHCTEAPPPLHKVAPWVPRGVAELVQKMLAKSMRERPQMPEVSQRLLKIQATLDKPPRALLQSLGSLRSIRALWRTQLDRALGRFRSLASAVSLKRLRRRIPARRPWLHRRWRIGFLTGCCMMLAYFVVDGLSHSTPPQALLLDEAPMIEKTVELQLISAPTGAAVYVGNTLEADPFDSILESPCKTPCTLTRQPGDEASYVILRKHGYHSRFILLKDINTAQKGGRLVLERLGRSSKK